MPLLLEMHQQSHHHHPQSYSRSSTCLQALCRLLSEAIMTYRVTWYSMWARPQIYAGCTKQQADTLVWQGRESQYKVKIEEFETDDVNNASLN